jgi:maltose O-acetyltransferase
MSRTGVRPLPAELLGRPRRAAVGSLPDDGRLALAWLRRGTLVTSPLLPLTVRRALLRLGGVKLGELVYGLERCYFGSPQVSVGAGSYINACCWFEGLGQIEIGRDCLIGPQVMFLTSTHAREPGGEITRESEQRHVRIGDGCWIGARATILPGVSVGAGTIVAAGAVVSKDCGPGGMYAGVPARRVW